MDKYDQFIDVECTDLIDRTDTILEDSGPRFPLKKIGSVRFSIGKTYPYKFVPITFQDSYSVRYSNGTDRSLNI